MAHYANSVQPASNHRNCSESSIGIYQPHALSRRGDISSISVIVCENLRHLILLFRVSSAYTLSVEAAMLAKSPRSHA